MNILLITMDFPPHNYGGASIYAQELCKLLAENKNNNIHVLTTGRQTNTEIIDKNLFIHRYRCSFKPLLLLPTFILQAYLNSGKLIRKFSIDSIHVNDVEASWILSKIPGVVTIHHLAKYNFSKISLINNIRNIYYILMEIFAVKNAVEIIAVSQMTKNDLLKQYTNLENKITIINTPIDITKFRNNKNIHLRKKYNFDQNTILFLCPGLAREERKGGFFLLKALQKIKKKDNVLFLFTGDSRVGVCKQKLINEVWSKGLFKIVRFLGELDMESLIEYYLLADVILLPSVFEGYGLPVLEAMAASKPVIATKTGEASYFIENLKNGIVVNTTDSEALYKSIMLLIDQPDLRITLGKNAFISLQNKIDRNKIRMTIETLYRKLLNKTSKSLKKGHNL